MRAVRIPFEITTLDQFVSASTAFRTSLLRFALSKGASYDDAEDAVSELILAIHCERHAAQRTIWQGYDRTTGPDGLYRYLCSAVTIHLRRVRRGLREWPSGLIETAADTELSEYERAEARLAMVGAKLTRRQRQALEARIEGYSNREIAEELGVTEQAVSQMIKRAIPNLIAAEITERLFRWIGRHTLKRDTRARKAHPWTGYVPEAGREPLQAGPGLTPARPPRI